MLKVSNPPTRRNYIEGERVKINDTEPRLYASYLRFISLLLNHSYQGESISVLEMRPLIWRRLNNVPW